MVKQKNKLEKIHSMILRKSLMSVMLATLSVPVLAQGLVLNDPSLRTDLNWLNQQGVIQISTSTWPLSGDEIQRALANAQLSNTLQQTVQQRVIDSVLAKLNADKQPLKLGLFAESDQKDIPQTFGDQQKAQFQAALELNAGSSNWDAKLRVNAEKDPKIDNDRDVNLEGSYLAGKLWNQWLVAGQIPTYWGPGHDGSLIRGDASRPVYGFTAQRAEQKAFENKWLSWVGPWQYQAFAGQLDNYEAIPHAKLLGLRVTAQPTPYLELGGSRALQWGGEGRPGSLSSLFDAFLGTRDNGGTGKPDPSNQLAGLDVRLNLMPLTQTPMGLYAQYIGEDEAGLMPTKKMYMAGADYSSSLRNMPYQVYAEWADTRTNFKVRGISYTHSTYRDGFYQHGYPLAHPLGGDAQMISMGGDIRFDPINRLSGRVLFAEVNKSKLSALNNIAFAFDDEIKALDFTWSHYIRQDMPLKLNAWISDSQVNGQDSGASIGIEIPWDRNFFSY